MEGDGFSRGVGAGLLWVFFLLWIKLSRFVGRVQSYLQAIEFIRIWIITCKKYLSDRILLKLD